VIICSSCQKTSATGIRCGTCDLLFCPRCDAEHVCANLIKPLWLNQVAGIEGAFEAERQGHRAIIVRGPTGCGKGRMIVEMAKATAEAGMPAAAFVNRRILTSQLTKELDRHGVDHEILAAGHNVNDRFIGERIKVCSMQTIESRVFKRRTWNLPPGRRVFIDEAHLNANGTARTVIEHYLNGGATVFGFDATPVNLGGLYTAMVHAGTKAELRSYGALVPCDVFAPNEPDYEGVKMQTATGTDSRGAVKRIMQCICFGDVFGHWKELNPFAAPTLLWAPGVCESRWFTEEFEKRGVRAAHIDGTTEENEREDILEASRLSHIKVVCSCGVLREGADLPWIVHGILVQPCGAAETFDQLVGRLLRAHPGKTRATLQDHAGAAHRHGSPNEDRDYPLDCTSRTVAKAEKLARADGTKSQPITCPKCGGIRRFGLKCPFCQHEHKLGVRMVIFEDGHLERKVDYPPRRKRKAKTAQDVWNGVLFMAGASGKTFKQAGAIFAQKTGNWPPPNLLHMPAEREDWCRRVSDMLPWTNRRKKKEEASVS
jgi:superfamily II DNA or RNA helicase